MERPVLRPRADGACAASGAGTALARRRKGAPSRARVKQHQRQSLRGAHIGHLSEEMVEVDFDAGAGGATSGPELAVASARAHDVA
jgi:hypothetical protein